MKTVIIDANNMIWRIAKKMPVLTAPDGNSVQIVYGFLRAVRSSLEMFEPDTALVAWDDGIPVARIEIWEGYKRSRREKKAEPRSEFDQFQFEDTLRQMEVIKQTLSYLCVAQACVENVEADDIIAIACRTVEGKKVVVSADHDMLQLVDSNTKVYFPLTKKPELYTHENFYEKTSLTPRQFVEVKAMIGDGSDGIPGIAKGFGQKSAIELMKKYGSAHNIWEHREKISKMPKRYASAVTKEAWTLFSRNMLLVDLSQTHSNTLARLIRKDITEHRTLDKIAVREYFKEQKFASLLKSFASWIAPFEALKRHSRGPK